MQKFRRAAVLLCTAVWMVLCCGCTGEEPRRKLIPERDPLEGLYAQALEPGMQIAEETIMIEGLQKEYTFLFLTDVHMVLKDGTASEQERQYAEERYPMFRDENGKASEEQFPNWINYANRADVDAVLLGGDIIDAPGAASVQWLQDQLARLEMPYLFVPGNHDWTFPWEYMTETGKQTYLPRLEPFTQGNTEINSLDLGELVVVGVNDSTNQVSEAALQEYERLYEEGRPMLVMAHVPFYTQSAREPSLEAWNSVLLIGGENIQPNEHSDRFMKMLTAQESPVKLVFAGHVHFYNKDVIKGEKDVLQLIGGAGYEGNAILLHIKSGNKHH